MPASAQRRPRRPALPRYLGAVSRRPPPSRRIRPTPDPPAGWRCRAAPLREGIAHALGTFCRGGMSWLLSGGLGDGGEVGANRRVQVSQDVGVMRKDASGADSAKNPQRQLVCLVALRRGGDQAGIGFGFFASDVRKSRL